MSPLPYSTITAQDDKLSVQHIGHVAVDSGLLVVGDPRYLAPHADLLAAADAECLLPPAGEPVRRLDFANASPEALKGVAGLIIPSGGDCVFPVLVEYDGDEPVRIVIDLDPEVA
jgi:hypothetical protein